MKARRTITLKPAVRNRFTLAWLRANSRYSVAVVERENDGNGYCFTTDAGHLRGRHARTLAALKDSANSIGYILVVAVPDGGPQALDGTTTLCRVI